MMQNWEVLQKLAECFDCDAQDPGVAIGISTMPMANLMIATWKKGLGVRPEVEIIGAQASSFISFSVQ